MPVPATLPVALPVPAVDMSGAASDAHLIELWLSSQSSDHTRRAYAADVQALLQATGGTALSALTVAQLEGWKQRMAQGRPPASANRRLTAVKSLLSYGHKTGYLLFNVGAAVQALPAPDRLSERILTEGETLTLLATAQTVKVQAVLFTLYYMALRVSELCGLQWQDLHLEAAVPVATIHGKGHKTRHVALPDCLAAVLRSLKADSRYTADRDPVFATRTGKAIQAHQVRRHVATAARQAGLAAKGVSPHWLRHAHASHALDRGAGVHEVQGTLGHASLATTSRYVHLRPERSSGHALARLRPLTTAAAPGPA